MIPQGQVSDTHGFSGIFDRYLSHVNAYYTNRISPSFLLILLLTALFCTSGSVIGFCEENLRVPAPLLFLSPGTRAVVVDKTHQSLSLYRCDKNRLVLERYTICTTGQREGTKEKPGDRRTPEGIYFCVKILLPPSLPQKYGPCALPLNYPNLIDSQHRRRGKGIWIHGIHENRLTRSTLGCVVLQNDDLVFLARRIHLYTTPIIIVKKVHFLGKGTLKNSAKGDLNLLKHWQKALVSGDLDTYLGCYAPDFTPKGMELFQWQTFKESPFEKRPHLAMVQIESPIVIHTNAYDLISFLETFHRGNKYEEGYKRLYLRWSYTGPKIVGEEWIPIGIIQKSEMVFQQGLKHLRSAEDSYRIIPKSQPVLHPMDEKIPLAISYPVANHGASK